MKLEGRYSVNATVDADSPLQALVEMTSDITEAFTVALLLQDSTRRFLDMAAFHTLSDHLISRARLPSEAGFWAGILDKQDVLHECHFEGDSTEFGLYRRAEPIRAYMAAPVGARGLLWVDSRKTYRFTPRHLKMLNQLAETANHLLTISEEAIQGERSCRETDLIRGLVPDWHTLSTRDNDGLDFAVRRIQENGEFEGVLATVRIHATDVFLITAAAGCGPWVRRGKLVRSRSGLLSSALEGRQAVALPSADSDNARPVIFHQGERLGLALGSVVVAPWSGASGEGALVLASTRPTPPGREALDRAEFLSRVVALVHSAAYQKRLLQEVRRYDGESGLYSEGYFRKVIREAFERARDRRGSLALLLVQIKDIDRLYLEHDHPAMNRLLEMVSDRLVQVADGHGVAGKYRTGGFGLLVEDLPAHELSRLLQRTLATLGQGSILVDGTDIPCDVRVAASHYPGDGEDLAGLWQSVLRKLELQEKGV